MIVKKIKIKDKEYGLQYGALHLKYLEKFGMEGMGKGYWSVIKNQYIIVLALICTWCELKNIECDLDLTDIVNWAEENWNEFMAIIEAWNNSTVAGKPIEEFAKDMNKSRKKKLLIRR